MSNVKAQMSNQYQMTQCTKSFRNLDFGFHLVFACLPARQGFCHWDFSNAFNPGRSCPERKASSAPPPVET